MIYSLEGTVVEVSKDRIALSLGPIAYEVFVARSADFSVGETRKIYTSEVLTQDDHYLVGFPDKLEKEAFLSLISVKGIGPKTAAALVTSIDISAFRGHDELASYCGVAPSDRRSGSSIRSTSPQRGGNRQLKNLLIFSCNSLIGTDNRFGRYYGECRARGMRHSKALKAVARKRLKVIYAIMRDAVPYAA